MTTSLRESCALRGRRICGVDIAPTRREASSCRFADASGVSHPLGCAACDYSSLEGRNRLNGRYGPCYQPGRAPKANARGVQGPRVVAQGLRRPDRAIDVLIPIISRSAFPLDSFAILASGFWRRLVEAETAMILCCSIISGVMSNDVKLRYKTCRHSVQLSIPHVKHALIIPLRDLPRSSALLAPSHSLHSNS